MDTSEFLVMSGEAQKDLKIGGEWLVCPECRRKHWVERTFCRMCSQRVRLKRAYSQSQLQAMFDTSKMEVRLMQYCKMFSCELWKISKVDTRPINDKVIFVSKIFNHPEPALLSALQFHKYQKIWNPHLKTWEKKEEGK